MLTFFRRIRKGLLGSVHVMKNSYLFLLIILTIACNESKQDTLLSNSRIGQNEDIVVHSYVSNIMSGFPPSDSNLVTLLNWDLAPYNRWAYQHFRELVPTQTISRGDGPIFNLPRNSLNIDTLKVKDRDGNTLTVKEMLDTTFTDAFIIIKDGQIITEQYFTGMQPSSLHLLQSCSKSLSISLLAALIESEHIDTTLSVGTYVPELSNSGYGDAKLSHLMKMKSGVRFSWDYDNLESEWHKLIHSWQWKPRAEVDKGQRYFLTNVVKERPHGNKFGYRNSETEVLAWVMEKRMGRSFAHLFSERIWSQIGAEYDAYIACDGLGSPITSAGFNVSLRDFARFGLLFLHDGAINGNHAVDKSLTKKNACLQQRNWFSRCLFRCPECGATFTRSSSACMHAHKRHGLNITRKDPRFLVEHHTWDCPACHTEMMWDGSTIKDHVRSCHGMSVLQFYDAYKDDIEEASLP